MNPFKMFMHLNAFCGFSLTLINYYEAGIKPEDLKKVLVLKVEDKEVPLPSNLKNLINSIYRDMKLEVKSYIQPFMSKSLDLIHSGFPDLQFKSFVGIPQYFAFDEKSNVNIVAVLDNVECASGSTEAKALDSSFRLSEKAKKFAIAQELYNLTHPSFYISSSLPIIVAGLANGMLIRTGKEPPPYIKKRPIFYCSIVSFFGFTFYNMVYDFIMLYKKGDCNYKTAQLGRQYIEGGIEFYEKTMQRNQALKSLNKNLKFSDNGDVKTNLLRLNTFKLQTQINYLKDLLEDIKSRSSYSIFWDTLYDNLSWK